MRTTVRILRGTTCHRRYFGLWLKKWGMKQTTVHCFAPDRLLVLVGKSLSGASVGARPKVDCRIPLSRCCAYVRRGG